jgi:hypothetical protein
VPFNEIVARYLKAVGDPREVVRDPAAGYFGGRSGSARSCRWAKRVSAISLSTNGSVARRQKPDAVSEVHPLISPAGASWLAAPRHSR